MRLPLLVSMPIVSLHSFALVSHAQIVPMTMTTVPASDAEPGGPAYDYDVALFEVTNAQYAAFLNDAEMHNEIQNPGLGDERGDHMRWREPPLNTGDVGLEVGDAGDYDSVFDISRSLLTYNSGLPVGQRYDVLIGKEDHPVVGMSWIGAVKFCNWLTIDHALGLGERCYAEGPGEVDWFPIVTGNDIDGTQQSNNLARDLNDDERCTLVRAYRGFRLLMDQGGEAVGSTNAAPRPFNEWFKAAAFDPDAPDTDRVIFPGFFEEHTVPADHWAHAFGRDALANADANFRDSGDPFDNPDPDVIATTPVGWYDGTNHGGFQTSANNNRYGIFDMSGNVWELMNDQVSITDSIAPDRAIAGGSYRSNVRQVAAANRGDVGPGTTRPVIGFRVMRVTAPPVIRGDLDHDCDIDVDDIEPFVAVLIGDNQSPDDIDAADINGDGETNGLDIQFLIQY